MPFEAFTAIFSLTVPAIYAFFVWRKSGSLQSALISAVALFFLVSIATLLVTGALILTLQSLGDIWFIATLIVHPLVSIALYYATFKIRLAWASTNDEQVSTSTTPLWKRQLGTTLMWIGFALLAAPLLVGIFGGFFTKDAALMASFIAMFTVPPGLPLLGIGLLIRK